MLNIKMEPESTDASLEQQVKSPASDQGKGSKDKGDKICGVCGDKALGCNFDAISCESCKAFFRRNALKEKVSFKSAFQRKLWFNPKLDRDFILGIILYLATLWSTRILGNSWIKLTVEKILTHF